MNQSIKIAIVGDYHFAYYSHQATNLSLNHAEIFLDVDIDYYWLKHNEIISFSNKKLEQFDGIWIAPSNPPNPFFIQHFINSLIQLQIPTFITGECFKNFIEIIIEQNQICSEKEKFISDNLVEGNVFEKINIIPNSKTFIKLFENHTTYELTSSRFSIYPHILHQLDKFIDIEAVNQFGEPEIVSLKSHPFFVVCGYCPQITSTRELPHPLVYTFIKACMIMSQKSVNKLND